MATIQPGYTHEEYEEVLTYFEVTQSNALNAGDIAEGARLANAFANTAHDLGNLSMAERCHRDAIYNYRLEDETERLRQPPEAIVPVRREIFGQYALLATVFSHRQRNPKTEYKLRKLNREILDTGPVAMDDVIAGLWALHITSDSLAKVGLGYRGNHVRRAQRYETLCKLAAFTSNLGIRMLTRVDDTGPRTMNTWLDAINKNGIA